MERKIGKKERKEKNIDERRNRREEKRIGVGKDERKKERK